MFVVNRLMGAPFVLTVVAAVMLLRPHGAVAQNLTVQDILNLPVPPADHRIAYGADPLQFGDLRLPKGRGPYPVAVVIHGGCWLSEYNLDHVASFCAELTRAGVATWSLEYRRIGNPGGGWPGTFEDVAHGIDHLRTLAHTYPLDLNRVVVLGHSAGGQLALWLAVRHRLLQESPLYSANPLPIQGVVSLAGVTDLRYFAVKGLCDAAASRLLGGSPSEVPSRYRETSPIEGLPLAVPERLIHGALDRIVPLELVRKYETAARKSGDDVKLTVLEEAGHFELIAPQSSAWPTVREAILSLLNRVGATHAPPLRHK